MECETRPNIKRLKAKASLRKKLSYRNNYILITTKDEYNKHDWRQLRGHFDQIYAYDPKKDCITEMTDLRTLGCIQDFFSGLFDAYMENKVDVSLVGPLSQKEQDAILLKGIDSMSDVSTRPRSALEILPKRRLPII